MMIALSSEVPQARAVVIAGGERAVAGAFVERGLERSELFQRAVRTQEAVAFQTTERHHQVVEEAGVIRGS